MAGIYSKLLHHSCYEIGHTWQPSCCTAAFEIFISSLIYSCQMYGIVYTITAAIQYKEMDRAVMIKLLKDYLRSVLFLTINGFSYIGLFCILRHLLGHLNYPSLSFIPGFLSALLAIYVERPSRRPLLAVYTANAASECFFNVCVGHGYVRPIPRGSALLFSAAMAVLGASYRSATYPLPAILSAAMRFLVGGSEQRANSSEEPGQSPHTRYGLLIARHPACPHQGSCFRYILESCFVGGAKGLLLSLLLTLVPSVPRLVRHPSLLSRLLLRSQHVRLAATTAWFGCAYRLACCCCRRATGTNATHHGALAGALAGAGMILYPSPTIALYTAWKGLEIVCSACVRVGVLPAVPEATELCYAFMTGYLFHVSALHQHYMKPSYWTLLYRLTDGRMAEFNRHLLYPYKADSSRNFPTFWPTYDQQHLSSAFLSSHSKGLASMTRL